MINLLLLLDVRPDPVSPGVNITSLILIGLVILMLTPTSLVGFVFLVRRFLRSRSQNAQQTRELQPSKPNQP